MPRDTSVSSWRVSRSPPSASSNRQTHTRVASGARTAKLVASSSWSAPSGQVRPGQTAAVSPRRLHVPGVTRDIVADGRHNAGEIPLLGGRAARSVVEGRRDHTLTREKDPMAEFVRLEVDEGVAT